MDPLSALSVVAAVVQFIDFGSKAVKELKDVHRSGRNLSQQNANLKDYASRITSQVATLEAIKVDPVDQASVALNKVCRQCLSSAKELMTVLDKISDSKSKRRWVRTIISGSKAVWWSEDIKRIQEQLDKQTAELNSQILVDVRNVLQRHATQVRDNLKSMSGQQQQVAEALLAGKQSFHDLTQVVEELSLQVESGFAQLNSVQSEALLSESDRRLRESLRFDEIDTRQGFVAAPAKGTFNWLLEDPSMVSETGVERPVLTYPLREWLMGEEKVYWICGKPGSGKSTLMNMISQEQQPKVLSLLNSWSKGDKAFLASHFFWRGDNVRSQMTIGGLLRTFLFRIVDEHHNLTHHLKEPADEKLTQPVWSVERLKRALFRILQCEERPSICFLVDALDEHRDDDLDLIDLISHISEYQRVKVCISSRPESNFKEAFNRKPHLQLEHITSVDITKYIEGQIRRIAPARNDLADLTTAISYQAQGVFLWVRCVIQRNLGYHLKTESVKWLLDEVQRMPMGIMELYESIFSRADQSNRAETALLFQLVTLSLSDEGNSDSWCSTIDLPLLAFVLFEREFDVPTYETNQDMVLSASSRLADTLQDRSHGLLEWTSTTKTSKWGDGIAMSFSLKPAFIHATAATFISQEFASGKLSRISDNELSERLFYASCRLVYCRLDVREGDEELELAVDEDELNYIAAKPLIERVFHWASSIYPTTQEMAQALEVRGKFFDEFWYLRSRMIVQSDTLDFLLFTGQCGTTLEMTKFSVFDVLCALKGPSPWAIWILSHLADISEGEIKVHLSYLLAITLLTLCSHPDQIWSGHVMGLDSQLKQSMKALSLIPYWIQFGADPNAEMIRPDGTHCVEGPISAWTFFLVWLWGWQLTYKEERRNYGPGLMTAALAFLKAGVNVSQRTRILLVFETSVLSANLQTESDTSQRTVFTVQLDLDAKFILSTVFESDGHMMEYIELVGMATEPGFCIREIARLPYRNNGRVLDLSITPTAIVTNDTLTVNQKSMLKYEVLRATSDIVKASGQVHLYITEADPLLYMLLEVTNQVNSCEGSA